MISPEEPWKQYIKKVSRLFSEAATREKAKRNVRAAVQRTDESQFQCRVNGGKKEKIKKKKDKVDSPFSCSNGQRRKKILGRLYERGKETREADVRRSRNGLLPTGSAFSISRHRVGTTCSRNSRSRAHIARFIETRVNSVRFFERSAAINPPRLDAHLSVRDAANCIWFFSSWTRSPSCALITKISV